MNVFSNGEGIRSDFERYLSSVQEQDQAIGSTISIWLDMGFIALLGLVELAADINDKRLGNLEYRLEGGDGMRGELCLDAMEV